MQKSYIIMLFSNSPSAKFLQLGFNITQNFYSRITLTVK